MNLRFFDGALFHEPTKTLVIADIHLGYEAELRAKGAFIPSTELSVATQRIERLVKRFNPDTVVFNGDVKHSFGRISDGEWRQLRTLMTALQSTCQVMFVQGNHDTHLAPIARVLDVELQAYVHIGDLLCLHGDALPDNNVLAQDTIIVIGHVHPAVTFARGSAQERAKCYLLGTYKDRSLIVLPSFLQLTRGADITQASSNTPLVQDFADFEVLVVNEDGSILPFGTVSELRAA